MRDPLAWIPVRFKLPATFGFLCLVAFGLGGYIVTTKARSALQTQIRARLDERASSLNLLVDKSLELLGRRVEDFASDGFIRLQLEALNLASNEAAEASQTREALVRHLTTNKLPLVEEFFAASLLDADAAPVLHTLAGAPQALSSFRRDGLWFGPLTGPTRSHAFPTFIVSTPITSIQGSRHIGFLQMVVRADTWIAQFTQRLADPEHTDLGAWLGSEGGHSLALAGHAESRTPPDSDVSGFIRFQSPIARSGWQLDLAIEQQVLSAPIDALVWSFLSLGSALVALTIGLMLFPQHFLLKPLSALQEAARRIAEGDFSARVESTSHDEVGELAGAFNFMASAIDERTRTLQQTAEVVKRREADIRFERDRLNTVIRSMEDGLFIMDAEGQITLSNVPARPVIEALAKRSIDKTGKDCKRRDGAPQSCLHCVSDFHNDVQGCVVTVDSRIYEINGAILSGPREAIAGKVFVSRDVTTRIRMAEQQAHQERLAVLGEIAAVMAHELNNPLAAISMFSQMLLKGLDSTNGMQQYAEVIHRNTESCKATIRSLLDMATTSRAEFAPFDVHQLISDVTQLLEPVAHRAGVKVEVRELARPCLAYGDELQLRQALVNLVMNAIQALSTGPRKGCVVLETADRGEEIAIRVRDTGPGIPEALRQHIFEPFFTTKAPGEGTGLGLSTSRRIADTQGGRLTLQTTGPEGTTFELVMPRPGVARRHLSVLPDVPASPAGSAAAAGAEHDGS